MRLTLHPSAPAAEPASAPVATLPRYVVTYVGDRTDLSCTVCGKVIAYGITPESAEADAAFYTDAHQPFCLATAG